MSQIFAERFKAARKMNGLSLEDLSIKLNKRITRQGLHKYEKGEVLPDSDMIGLLSLAFNVRPEYFSREVKVDLGSIHFRKLDNFPKKEKIKIIEKTRETISRYLELEEIIGIKKEFVNPIKGIKVDSNEKVEEAAEKLRSKWELGMGPIYNVIELLEDKNIKVIESNELDGFDGMQTNVNRNIPVIALNTTSLIQNDRKRFTALHELGHLLLEFVPGTTEKQKEMYCHYFAGAMLFPREAAYQELGKTRSRLYINELGVLKQYYGISLQALIHRLKNIGIITNAFSQQFISLIKQMGWKIEEPYPYVGREISNRFTQLIFRALGEEQISLSKAASLCNKTLAEFRQDSLIMV